MSAFRTEELSATQHYVQQLLVQVPAGAVAGQTITIAVPALAGREHYEHYYERQPVVDERANAQARAWAQARPAKAASAHAAARCDQPAGAHSDEYV